VASVFLSYDHEDVSHAAPLAAALETHGHSVWWDRHIHGGAEYNSEIETAVAESDAVVVLWSDRSVRSPWVRDEAAEGRDAGKLVPVLIERVKPPMGFRQFQTIDLAGWNGGKRVPQLPELLRAIDRAAGLRPTAERERAPRPVSPAQQPTSDSTGEPLLSRRLAMGGGTAAVLALVGGGAWWVSRSRDDPQVSAAIDGARDALGKQAVDEATVKSLERAVALDPGNAKALGMLALVSSLVSQIAEPEKITQYVSVAEKAARQALALDRKEPNALLAMFELQGSTLDWSTRDQRLRDILAIDADNIVAISELTLLTQGTGMCRESWDWNERAIALEPLSLEFLGRRALKLWILGHSAQADKVADQLLALNPKSDWAWFVRFHLFVYTGRVRAAQAMLDSEPTMGGRKALARVWNAALPAIEQRTASTIEKARQTCIEAAKMAAQAAGPAVQVMATLGDLDTAFDIANGLLLAKGQVIQQHAPDASTAWWRLSTQWMFTPAAAPLFGDQRFLALCEGIGLTDYWRKRGVKPDYQRA
jgi:hypothetical protein